MNEERILNQLSDHEKTLTLMSKVVEDINKNLDRFASANEKLTKEMAEHWHLQDKIMTKMEAILESMSKYEARFTKIEDRQINGCPNFLNFIKSREEQLKRYDLVIDGLHKAIEKLTIATQKNREEIEENSSQIGILVSEAKVRNKRIADLEAYQKDNEKWKMGIYITIAGKALVIAVFFYMLWHGGMK
jgi:uncharacterized protein Yka (UPF0111/DUF47 family)